MHVCGLSPVAGYKIILGCRQERCYLRYEKFIIRARIWQLLWRWAATSLQLVCSWRSYYSRVNGEVLSAI